MDGLLGSGIIAALIAAAVSVLGWWVGHANDRRAQQALRKEKIRDIMTALRSEIRSSSFLAAYADSQSLRADTRKRILASGGRKPAYTPFIPREPDTPVFRAIVGEIHILPGSAIDPVILYYSQAATIAQFADDLRSERYSTLAPERKATMYDDYMAMRDYAAELAADAIKAIDEVSDEI